MMNEISRQKQQEQQDKAKVPEMKQKIEEKAHGAWQKAGDWQPEVWPNQKQVKEITNKTQGKLHKVKKAMSVAKDILSGRHYEKKYWEALARGAKSVSAWALFTGRNAWDVKKDKKALELAKDKEKGLTGIA